MPSTRLGGNSGRRMRVCCNVHEPILPRDSEKVLEVLAREWFFEFLQECGANVRRRGSTIEPGQQKRLLRPQVIVGAGARVFDDMAAVIAERTNDQVRAPRGQG